MTPTLQLWFSRKSCLPAGIVGYIIYLPKRKGLIKWAREKLELLPDPTHDPLVKGKSHAY